MDRQVVYVVGSTATGKTKLGIELCDALRDSFSGAEIINADALQVYRRYDIGTAKATASDTARVRHHLLDVCDFDEEYNAHRFVTESTAIIDHLHSRNVLPVVVGGTQMYVQGLLWRSALDITGTADEDAKRVREDLEKLSTAEAFKHLEEVDSKRVRRRIC
eukprot:Selendium_serpulae@DN5624_c0_g1_i5.p1